MKAKQYCSKFPIRSSQGVQMSSTAKPCPGPAPHASLHSSSLSLYHSIRPGWTNRVIPRAQHISWSILWMLSVWLELKTHFSPSTFSSSFFKLVYFKENLAHVFLIIPNSFALNSSKCCFAKAFCFPRLLKSFFLVLSAYPTPSSPHHLFSLPSSLFVSSKAHFS